MKIVVLKRVIHLRYGVRFKKDYRLLDIFEPIL
jgi:hypothetical protein